MNTAIELAQFAWNVLFGLGTLLALIWSWTLRRSAADAASLTSLHSKLSEQDNEILTDVAALNARIGRVEERVSHLPTDKSIAEIRQALAQIGVQVGQLTGEQRTTMRMVERMNQYLMERE